MSRFISPRFNELEEYVPGEQPRDMNYIKLNTNESPYPPSKRVCDSVCDFEVSRLNLYPDPTAAALKAKVAARYHIKPENVFISNGSDEILSFAFMAFCDKDTGVAYPTISYGFYEVYAALYGVDALPIPLADDFSLRVQDYLGLHRTIVIANPNAPTGMAISVEQIEQILISNPDNLVLIDEAYIDFGAQSCLGLIGKYGNLLVVRTYSKSRCLAGARLGFAMASKEIIADLEKIKFSTNPYNINRLSLVAGEAAIDDDEYYTDRAKEIINTRAFTAGELKKLGFTMTDSYANFVFARHNKLSGEDVYLELKKRGILIRHFSKPEIADYNRITIGTKEQMQALISALAEITEQRG